MSISISRINRKSELITSYLSLLQPLVDIPLDEFLSDSYKVMAAERLLEITIQAALDINNHILKEHFSITASSSAEGFLEMGRRSIVPLSLAQNLRQSAGLRNRLAHEYDTIQPEMIFQILPLAVKQYAEYIRCINNFIDSIEV
jgi:uncharacterized protein YutE (UPF0331/DUF86 family)